MFLPLREGPAYYMQKENSGKVMPCPSSQGARVYTSAESGDCVIVWRCPQSHDTQQLLLLQQKSPRSRLRDPSHLKGKIDKGDPRTASVRIIRRSLVLAPIAGCCREPPLALVQVAGCVNASFMVTSSSPVVWSTAGGSILGPMSGFERHVGAQSVEALPSFNR